MLALFLLALIQTEGEATTPKPGKTEFPDRVLFFKMGDKIVSQADKDKYRWKGAIPNIDIANESFRVIVPKEYATGEKWGLLVWCSPSEYGGLRGTRDEKFEEDWLKFLVRNKMLFVAANNAPNTRNHLERLQLALSAVANMKMKYSIDDKRVVVAGFSGGAKIACLAGRYAPEMFCGVIAVCGPIFHHNAPDGNGVYYAADMVISESEERTIKKRVAFVFITGEKDYNYNPSIAIEKAYRKYGFKSLLLEVPELNHSVPKDLVWFDKSLEFIFDPNAGAQERSAKSSKATKSTKQSPKRNPLGSSKGKR